MKVEVLGSPSLIVLMVSADAKEHLKKKEPGCTHQSVHTRRASGLPFLALETNVSRSCFRTIYFIHPSGKLKLSFDLNLFTLTHY